MSLRTTNIARLSAGEPFDVLVVGGGINGAVTAAACAARGASVALIDRGDFAGFTSQESSNLVWGGFKYLENYEFSLVRHLCMSRNRLIRAYPSNVKEIRFLAALDQTAPYAPWFAGAGTFAYWAIGNFFTAPPRVISTQTLEFEEPIIDVATVRGAVEYSDAYLVDNDSRFVFGFVRSALNVGAVAVNYMELESASFDRTWTAQLHDVDNGGRYELFAKVLVNATGPFVDDFNSEWHVQTNHRIVLSKGVHLIVPRLAGHERILAFFDDTARLFYVIPMGPCSVIGTTDTRVDDPYTEVTDEDRDFLLEQINKRLKLHSPLTRSDIIAERCGVRPLVVDVSDKKDAGDQDWTLLSRKHVVEVEDSKALVTIFGGKLTDCLNIGAEIAAQVERLGVFLEPDRNDWYGEPPKAARREFFRQARLMRLDRLRKRASFETLSMRLWRRYGLRAFAMLEEMRDDPTMADEVIDSAEYLRVELHFAARTEMIMRLEDFLRRRSKIALVIPHDEVKRAEGIQEACRILFGDDASRRYEEYFGEPAEPGMDFG